MTTFVFRTGISLLVLGATSVLLASSAHAADDRTVAVWVQSGQKVPPRIAGQAIRAIGEQLAQHERIVVGALTRQQLRQTLRGKRACRWERAKACAQQVAAYTESKHVILARVDRLRRGFRITALLATPADDTVEPLAKLQFSPETLDRTCADIASAYATHTAPPPVAEADVFEEEAPAQADLSLSRSFSQAASGAISPGNAPPAAPPPAPVAVQLYTPASKKEAPPEIGEEWPTDEPNADVLHARALLAEADGKVDKARELLREAQAIVPEHEEVVFDLARLALEYPGKEQETDLQGLIAISPTKSKVGVMQAHAHFRLGNQRRGREALEQAMRSAPENQEAQRLNQAVGKDDKSKWVYLRASSAVQYDSNVAVLPDDAGLNTPAWRGVVDARANVVSPTKPLSFRGGIGTNLGFQISARKNPILEPLRDVGAADASLGIAYATGDFHLSFTGRGQGVFLDSMQTLFMAAGGVDTNATYLLGSWRLGLYASGLYRDFMKDNAEGEAADRDGPRLEGGISAALRVGRGALTLRAGPQWEVADGELQEELGGRALLAAQLMLDWLSLSAHTLYEYRDHIRVQKTEDTPERTEHRVTAGLNAEVPIHENVQVFVSLAWLLNFSSPEYAYQRGIASTGVQTTW